LHLIVNPNLFSKYSVNLTWHIQYVASIAITVSLYTQEQNTVIYYNNNKKRKE